MFNDVLVATDISLMQTPYVKKIPKLSILYISSPLTYICNKMISTSTFPSRLNFSEIQPSFKKDVNLQTHVLAHILLKNFKTH